MSEPPEQPQVDELPEVDVEAKRGLSIVWLIPLVALVVGIWLAYTTISQQGPTITITFKSAGGLEAEKTKLKYKDVEVGHVESVEISNDLSHVIVQARMVKGAAPHLNEGTKFWAVRPRVGARGVSGLGTLFFGAYIAVQPGEGNSTRTFTGLEEPPSISSDIPGQRYVLLAKARGSLNIGSPIYFRNFEVGQVTDIQLAEENQGVALEVFIRDPHHALITSNTRFWNASGINVSVDADGIEVQMTSLETLIAGGISFETPDGFGEPVEPGHQFGLYDSYASTSEPIYSRKLSYLLYFDESIRGLDIGASVEFRGIRVGTVQDVRMEFDVLTNRIRIPVLIDVEPDRIPRVGGDTARPTLDESKRRINALVERGLRGQLRTGNFITGKRYIGFDLFPNTPMQLADADSDIPQLPTTPTVLGEVEHAASDLMTKLQKLPLEQIAQNLLGASEGLNHLINDPELQKTVRSANTTLKAFRELAEDIDRNVIPSAQKTLEGLDENSPVYRSVVDTLDQLSMTARSLRVFAEYLERHPEALLRGKQ